MIDGHSAPVSVVIRTIGRADLLRACLESLAGCDPRPGEVVVVDQSGGHLVDEVVRSYDSIRARCVTSTVRGRALALNVGLRAAAHDVVLVTDDDCTVAPTWVGTASERMAEHPDGIVTGRVLAGGDPDGVPSTITDETPREWTGRSHYGALYTGNMACNRHEVLALGGFDERIAPAAEDNDFCYRWLRAGRALRFDPDLVVWHHHWRSHAELEQWYVEYARSQGLFYAKHLRGGDLRMLRFISYDVFAGLRGHAAALVLGRPRWSDAAQGILRGLPRGLLDGWRLFRRAPGTVPPEQGP